MSTNLDQVDVHHYISRIALARAIKSMDEGEEELWKTSVIFNQPFVKKLLAYHQASIRKNKVSFPSKRLGICHHSVELNTKVTMGEEHRQGSLRNNSNLLYSPVTYHGHYYDAQTLHHNRYHFANPSLMIHHRFHYLYHQHKPLQ
ncbi:hypothetical protein AB4K20DRAFT_1864380 [Rhizopus microsporus]|uniref:Uncharacterized protein n=1 Tax=Rhizopus microsporus TaxID=58291 RepID=A0A1X0RQ47_RHIZD|nr:hypothetical protein BCV71DRAFT_276453 [Rhizopus microsporus]